MTIDPIVFDFILIGLSVLLLLPLVRQSNDYIKKITPKLGSSRDYVSRLDGVIPKWRLTVFIDNNKQGSSGLYYVLEFRNMESLIKEWLPLYYVQSDDHLGALYEIHKVFEGRLTAEGRERDNYVDSSHNLPICWGLAVISLFMIVFVATRQLMYIS
ncbi:hypothetical protein ACYPKM_03595 [Pseudomonas aeruginosa]